jgi:hypothetical protein
MPINARAVMKVKDDLLETFERLKEEEKKKKKRRKSEAAAEDGPDPIGVLVDILLSFLAEPSSLLRHAVEQVRERKEKVNGSLLCCGSHACPLFLRSFGSFRVRWIYSHCRCCWSL